jgi:hypothetical protein
MRRFLLIVLSALVGHWTSQAVALAVASGDPAPTIAFADVHLSGGAVE